MAKFGTMAGLPGYAFDTKIDRYRNLDTGRMVSRGAVEELLRGVTESAAERMSRLGAACNGGALNNEEFVIALQTEMKRTGNAAASMAAGGWDRMTPSDWGHQGAWVKEQNAFLEGFYQDLQNPEKIWTVGEIERRAGMYAGTAFSRYWEKKNRDRGPDALAKWVVISDERTCIICLALAAKGVVPVSELPLPGSIHNFCRCSLQYQDKGA